VDLDWRSYDSAGTALRTFPEVYRLQQTAHLKHDSDLICEGIRGSAERLPGSLPHLAEGTGPAKTRRDVGHESPWGAATARECRGPLQQGDDSRALILITS
jgi:hypothetical protein